MSVGRVARSIGRLVGLVLLAGVSLQLYFLLRIALMTVVDPDARTLEARVLRDGQWVEAGAFDDTAVARIAPFEAIELPIGRLFLPRPPASPDDPEAGER